MSSIHADFFDKYYVSTALLDDPMINLLDNILLNPSSNSTYETMVFSVDKNGEPDWGAGLEYLRTTSPAQADENHRLMVEKYKGL